MEIDILIKLIETGVTGAFLITGVIIIRLLLPVVRDHLGQQREVLQHMTDAIDGITDIVQRLDVRMGKMERRMGYADRFEMRSEQPVVSDITEQ